MTVGDFEFDPAFKPRLRILSLGAGVQSSVLALMAAAGEIRQPLDCAIFADTHHEPKVVYRWLEWLEKQLPFPVHHVSKGDLWKAATRVRERKDGRRKYIQTGIPIYTAEGLRRGIGRRQCTRDFKINPINAKARSLLGMRAVPKRLGQLVEMWIGISTDEAIRMKPNHQSFIRSRWPLIELGMSRDDCLSWMRSRGFPEPPRSACTFCPFHDDDEWLNLTSAEFSDCAAKEKEMQAAYKQTNFRATPYFHDSRVPLDRVALRRTTHPKQLALRLGKFVDECEGMCGV